MRRESSELLVMQTENKLIKRLLYACLREELLPHTLKENKLIIPLQKNQKLLIADNVKQFRLGRFKIGGEITLITKNQSVIISEVNHFLDLIYGEISHSVDPKQWKQFVKEIHNCSVNEALVTSFFRSGHRHLAHYAQHKNHKNFIDYISSHYSTNEQLIFFESWAAKGHPYHPCHKTKLGFSAKAYVKYSPEFNQDIHLPIAAIKKSLLHVECEMSQSDYSNWFSTQFPIQWKKWINKLSSLNLISNDYYPIFIHPWQYRNVLTKLFQPIIENGQLRIFNDIFIKTKASLSFRTLISKENHHQPHIKLPVAVRSTSAMRTISPASVENGPKLGLILKEIFSNEKLIEKNIKFAYENYGLHINYPNAEIAKHLAVIYRENPSKIIQKNELPIVVAALFEESPITHLPIFIEMLQARVGSEVSSAKQYFDQYCRVVIPAYFDLFLKYGIALEGHQQNTIAVFENYFPKYMIARDLGGLRIHAPTLSSQGFLYRAHPDSATITNDRQEVTNKFLHTVIQYHLGEIILLLAEHYHTKESDFWNIVKNNIEERFNYLRNKVDNNRWKEEYNAILVDDWQIKGLMRMRLNNVYSKYIYINLKNPLRDA